MEDKIRITINKKEEFINKRNILYKAFKLIEMDIDKVDNGEII